MEELIKAQKEYIEFLDKHYSNVFAIAHVHGFKVSDEDIKKGEILRDKIAKYEEQVFCISPAKILLCSHYENGKCKHPNHCNFKQTFK